MRPRGNVQGFCNIYKGTTSSGPLVSCSGFSWATRQWGELGNPGVSAVKRGCLMTYLRSLTTFNTFRFARAGWENWANWAQLEVLLPERSPPCWSIDVTKQSRLRGRVGVNGIHLGQLPLLTLHHSCPGGLLPELGSVEPGSPQLTGK